MSWERHTCKQTWLVRLGVLGAWLVFTLMVLTISWGVAASRDRPFDALNNAVWNLGWVLWAGATFGVQALARRFPVKRHHLGRTLLLHVVFGLIVTAIMLGGEFLLDVGLGKLWPVTIRPNPLVTFVFYKFHIYFLIYWLIVGATGAYDYSLQLRRSELAASQLEAKLAQAQIQALKMQLHPHFLFNTHHSIISLMLKNENPAAIKMLTRLSDLLRITLKKTDQSMNSLGEELELLELYLGIQRERFRDCLTVKMEVSPGAVEAEVPCLLLQPLVENALQHGINSQGEGGQLFIGAERVGDKLKIEIRDNGPGFPPNFALDQSNGVGLGNTRARLEHHYGAGQQFEIVLTGGVGAVVRVVLPFKVFVPARSQSANA